jgi:asparagine synthase (glutamine-hydrolysing)
VGRRELLARDRVGKKPLFYATKGDTMWFASEARAILEDPEVERTVDFDAIDCFLQLQYVPHPLSAFAAPRRLPPGHTLVWHDGEIRLARPVLEAFLPARRHRQPARGTGTNPLSVAGSDGAAVA